MESDEEDSVSLASDEYYPTVAIGALMRILKNPSLETHHNRVIEVTVLSVSKGKRLTSTSSKAAVLIFRSIGTRCLPFLPRVIGPFLNTMQSAEPEFRGFLFQQLSILISIVKQHIRPYLPQIITLVKEQWGNTILAQVLAREREGKVLKVVYL